MSPNPPMPAREPVLYSFGDWESVGIVKSAIRNAEIGQFDMAARVVDAMGRDDRISGCCGTRFGALPSLPMSLEPRGDGRMKKRLAAAAEEDFEEMFPDSSLSELLHWGRMLGVGLGQLHWDLGTTWKPRLKVWHPRNIYYRWDTRSFWVNTEADPVEIHPGDGQWVLFTPYGSERGWMYGKVRALYVPWLLRRWGMRDWARYSEVHGLPIRKIVTPPGADEKAKEAFHRDIANIGTESNIRTPRVAGSATGMDTDRFDIELLEATGKSTETFEKLLDKADACIAIALLGQNLTTEVKGGSYAAAKGHMQVRNDVLQSDAELLGHCLREQALKPWAIYNFGAGDSAPMPTWRTRPPEDKVQKGQALKNLGDGISAIQATGGKPDIDALMDADEVPTLGPAEPPTREEAAGIAAPAADPNQGEGVDPSRKPLPRAKTPVAKASRRGTKDSSVPDAAVQGQLYADDLTESGRSAGGKALAKDLQAVLEVVQGATDYEQLRAALLKRYGKMSREDLGEMLKHALMLAELNGRHAVREESAD